MSKINCNHSGYMVEHITMANNRVGQLVTPHHKTTKLLLLIP